MTKENTQSCEIALNIFKMSELNFKNQLDLLQTAISQRKSFRTLTLLINNIKETTEELRKAAEKVFLENPHPSTVSSITERQSNLRSKLQIFEHEVNSLMTMDNSTSRPHDYEMTLASVRSAAHVFLNPTDHRQHEQRSQHRRFRTTIMKLKLYSNLHQYLPGQNLPSFCQQTAIHNHCYHKFPRTSQIFSAKKSKANQQLDTSTNPFAFDTFQTDELIPNASGDITLLPTKQPIDVSFQVDVSLPVGYGLWDELSKRSLEKMDLYALSR